MILSFLVFSPFTHGAAVGESDDLTGNITTAFTTDKGRRDDFESFFPPFFVTGGLMVLTFVKLTI